MDDAAQRLLVKLNSLGIAVDEASLPDSIPLFSDEGLDIPKITRAIAEHQILEFTYRNYDLSVEKRNVVPIGLSTRSGYWYLAGVDQSIEEVRPSVLIELSEPSLLREDLRSSKLLKTLILKVYSRQ